MKQEHLLMYSVLFLVMFYFVNQFLQERVLIEGNNDNEDDAKCEFPTCAYPTHEDFRTECDEQVNDRVQNQKWKDSGDAQRCLTSFLTVHNIIPAVYNLNDIETLTINLTLTKKMVNDIYTCIAEIEDPDP
tara:strand:+ start:3546 stop:3938 length:393 start_codon:yes stop_codon:yes gene_type:complete